ncbi:unnamed protein product [Fusarium graminearum]|uniref:Chromosome 4, complete genome n=1 Tax=Gibberella zeae (strain ATCC MYA-4620 / CBS 123657 / FGSC 9075 / NRRL 31084 / PH-1) TaxID=229533 RepID=A0A098DNR1_GIBZE|nr:unnamed protein product [Fusarium graminearum]CZS73308.1 unnamed protein product [Fusarium graminearum]
MTHCIMEDAKIDVIVMSSRPAASVSGRIINQRVWVIKKSTMSCTSGMNSYYEIINTYF